MDNQIKIYEDQFSSKVVKEMAQKALPDNIQAVCERGELHKVFYSEEGRLVAMDIYGSAYTA